MQICEVIHLDCRTCKKHYSQVGRCMGNKENCLFYENEPRGKMIRTTLSFEMNNMAETPIIKYNSKVIFEDNGKDIEMTIIKINWINLKTMICNVDVEYHENEMPHFEKVKMFKIVNQDN